MSSITPVTTPSHGSLVMKPTLAQHATSSHQYLNCISIAASYVSRTIGRADMAIVLGSGLMDFVDKFSQSPPPKSIAYDQVPYMPGTNVAGHTGRIYVGELPTKNGLSKVMCFAGRVHAYEGWNPTEFNFIVRLAHACGVKVMLLTNSAGGALSGMSEGSIMMIEDHLRFSGINPLKDVCEDPRFGQKFCTSSLAYSKRIQGIVKEAAAKLKMDVLSGTYCWTSGPSYETPAEVQAGIVLSVNSQGGAFGMSTVPEVLAAHNLGMEVFAVSLCTNLAAGLSDKELTHGDVKTVAEIAGPRFQNLLLETFANLSVHPEESKKLLPSQFDPTKYGEIEKIAAIPTHALSVVAGWTPSLNDILESIEKIKLINEGSNTEIAAGVIFLGGRGQAEVQHTFLAALNDIKTTPLRELSPKFTSPDMLSSYFRTGLLVLGSLPTQPDGALGKRVLAVVSNDGNGICGLTSAEYSWLVQVAQGLGVSTLLASAVGVDTSARTIGGDVANGAASSAPHPNQVVLLEDVFDRQVDPLPLTALTQVPELKERMTRSIEPLGTPVFDVTLYQPLTFALNDANRVGKKHHGTITVKTGAYLSFQGPMLPTEAELNMTVHAGEMETAGISNLSFVDVAKELGFKIGVIVRTVAHINDLPQPPHDPTKPINEDAANVSHSIAHALLHVIEKEEQIDHYCSNVLSISSLDFVLTSQSALQVPTTSALGEAIKEGPASGSTPADGATAATASSSSSTVSIPPFVPVVDTVSLPLSLQGYGPVAFSCHQERVDHVRDGAGWIAREIAKHHADGESSLTVKSCILVEGMLQEVFAKEEFKLISEWPVLQVPHFAEYLGLNADGTAKSTGLPKSGSCFPYDPRVLMASWVFRLGSLSNGSHVLLIQNTVDRSGYVPMFHGLNYLIRCMKYLESTGITNVLVLTPLASCDADLAPQQLVLVKDHINFTGLNPLFGENTADFGPRFNDMTMVYKRNGIACFSAQPGYEGIKSTTTAQVVNPALSSLSESALCRSIKASTVVSGFVPITTICKHMDLFVTAVGYVYRTAGTNDDPSIIHATPLPTAAVYRSETNPSAETIKSLRTIVVHAVNHLHDAGLVHIAQTKAY